MPQIVFPVYSDDHSTLFFSCVYTWIQRLHDPVHVVVSVTESVNMDDRGKQLFASMFNRACEAIKDLDALERIESL